MPAARPTAERGIRAHRWLSGLLLALAAPLAAQESPATESKATEARAATERPPNVILILADDLGYGDLSIQGSADLRTPFIDSIAREGVSCTNGYVTAPRCAPTRSGLLTGRYQQRFGCELDAERGLGAEVTLATRLKAAGYATGIVGKWHLGKAEADQPGARGFDEFFGFLGGSSNYLPSAEKGVLPNILRNREPAGETDYLTDALEREAVAFVERHRDEPFFLYLPFNAAHRPMQATEADLARFPDIADPTRRTYAAMVASMDDAIGALLAKLRELELDERTLVVFLNDNGGPLAKGVWNGSSNGPLRGQKSSTYEGALRVAYFLRWPGTLPAGKTFDAPVSSLDLFPTALRAAGVELDPAWALDGVDLLPCLLGRTEAPPHDVLLWRFNFPPAYPTLHKWAIRQGDWKLVHSPDRHSTEAQQAAPPELYDLAHDPGETHDVAAEHPELVRSLHARWSAWDAGLPAVTPDSGGGDAEPGADDDG